MAITDSDIKSRAVKPIRLSRAFTIIIPVALLAGLGVAACANREQTASAKPPHGTPATVVPVRQPPLKPLDETTAAEFRRAFDQPSDRTRFIVALSPT